VIEDDNAFQQQLSDAVLAKLVFNDQNLLQARQAMPTTFMSYTITGTGSNTGELVTALYAFQPDVVFSFAGDTFTHSEGVMTNLNGKYWANERPFYILSPENQAASSDVRDELEELKTLDHKDRSGRILGVGAAQIAAEGRAALQHLILSLTPALPDARTDFGNYYDAFYFLTYAMYASGPRAALLEGTVHATNLANGMRRLTDLGQPPVQIDSITGVFNRLDASLNIQLVGTLGAPDFNSTTGMRRESGSVFCFNSVRSEQQNDVIRFDRATNKLIQESPARCLLNFLGPQ
jgi:hypothetical protein